MISLSKRQVQVIEVVQACLKEADKLHRVSRGDIDLKIDRFYQIDVDKPQENDGSTLFGGILEVTLERDIIIFSVQLTNQGLLKEGIELEAVCTLDTSGMGNIKDDSNFVVTRRHNAEMRVNHF